MAGYGSTSGTPSEIDAAAGPFPITVTGWFRAGGAANFPRLRFRGWWRSFCNACRIVFRRLGRGVLHRTLFCQIAIRLPKAICRVFGEMLCVTMSGMALSRCTMLPAFSVVAFSGRDARSFLQGQLTNDLLGLERQPGLLAAACNREGRVLEILRLASHGDTVLAVLRRALVAPMIARLARHVLRADVKIDDRGDTLGVAGVLDSGPAEAWVQSAAAVDVTLLVAGARRLLLVGSPDSLKRLINGTGPASPADWERGCIKDGEPSIHPDTAGQWIPQMLNLDLLSAISFSKGCYVGQEIVARTQHLGRIKRRTLRYAGPAGEPPGPGQALYSGATQAAQVVAACQGPRGLDLLAVTELRFRGDLLRARQGGGEFAPADLPYVIPAPLA